MEHEQGLVWFCCVGVCWSCCSLAVWKLMFIDTVCTPQKPAVLLHVMVSTRETSREGSQSFGFHCPEEERRKPLLCSL